MSPKHAILRPDYRSQRCEVEGLGVNAVRWKIATAFIYAASKLRIAHRERAMILEKSNGLDGLAEKIRIMKDESKQMSELNRLFARELSIAELVVVNEHDRAISVVDDDYPKRLLHSDQPPSILFCRGKEVASLHDSFIVTVIGTRNPSFYGLEVTNKLCKEMARRGITIVSGGARGIDGRAHEAAISGGTSTVAVLGCGVDVVYPKEHASLFNKIVQSGALISEYPSGTMPRRHHFPARNRILAGLCDAVLVTEASRFSGTLITAGFAADYGRDVCAVPGSILSGTSHSCHDLIRDGAIIVESIDDIPNITFHPVHRGDECESVGRSSIDRVAGKGRMNLGTEEECILNLLEAAPRTLRAVSVHCHLDLSSTAFHLATLQGKGLVRLYRGLYVRAGA